MDIFHSYLKVAKTMTMFFKFVECAFNECLVFLFNKM